MTFLSNLEWRYATKKFDGRKLTDETVAQILEAIRMAPTSFGIQPFHVTVVVDDELKAKLKPHAMNQEQVTTCSHLLVFSTDSDMDKRTDDYVALSAKLQGKEVGEKERSFSTMVKSFAKQGGEEWAARQTYIALGFALAACAELQVDSCPMEGFDPSGFKGILNLPVNLNPKAFMTIGYRSPENAQAPKIRFAKDNLFDFR
ncbi:MAG: NAD(P)H-dependent oxidoreductase [Patescibacteria group bacterium]